VLSSTFTFPSFDPVNQLCKVISFLRHFDKFVLQKFAS
jgi:hypothetical protein